MSKTIKEHIFNSREEADEVLDALKQETVDCGCVYLADYYDMIGKEPTYTDTAYGWSDVTFKHAVVKHIHEGFVINFPPLEKIGGL